MRIDEQTWPEVKKAFTQGVAIVPIGATEQHGPHLPLGTDSIIIEHIARQVGLLTNLPVLPTLSFSVSGYNFPYPTITLEPETLQSALHDICASLAFFGIHTVFFLVGHGGENCNAVENAAYCITRDLSIRIKVMYPWTYLSEDERALMTTDWHAGLLETCDMLSIRPDLVSQNIPKGGIPKPMKFIINYKHAPDIPNQGVLGQPAGATDARGEKNLKQVTQKIAEEIRGLISA